MTRQDLDYIDEDSRLYYNQRMLESLDSLSKSKPFLEAEHLWHEAQIERAEMDNEAFPTNALKKQVGGNHYSKLAIQPVDYIVKNNLGFLEGNVVKYITRWREKGGLQDLDKVIHYVELIKQFHAGMVK